MYLRSEMYIRDYYSSPVDLIDALALIRKDGKMKILEHGYCQESRSYYLEYMFLKEK